MLHAPSLELYARARLMTETRELAARYRKTMGTVLPVTREIARYDAAQLLHLLLVDPQQHPYDALGTGARQGIKYLIKGRALFEQSRSAPRMGQINPQQAWDAVLLVLFDDDYQAIEIYEAQKADITRALQTHDNPSRKKRGAMSIAQFKIIGECIWTQDLGHRPQVWDNHID